MGIRKRKSQPHPEQALHDPNCLFDIVENTKEPHTQNHLAYPYQIWLMFHRLIESI